MIIWAGVRMCRGDVLLAESADWEIKPEANFAGAALVFLIARAFSSGYDGTDRHRGDQQRRAGLPQAEEQERRDHPG